jgi:hypothetical protein
MDTLLVDTNIISFLLKGNSSELGNQHLEKLHDLIYKIYDINNVISKHIVVKIIGSDQIRMLMKFIIN